MQRWHGLPQLLQVIDTALQHPLCTDDPGNVTWVKAPQHHISAKDLIWLLQSRLTAANAPR
jgi:hypothetical protein